jgi:hypothetical protein
LPISCPFYSLAWPTGAGFGENHLYVNDTYNRRVVRFVRVDFELVAEATDRIPPGGNGNYLEQFSGNERKH